MDNDVFNMSMRKFLKTVGVTSQREIEQAVAAAIESGKLPQSGSAALKISCRLEIEAIGMVRDINGEITLEQGE